MSLNKISFGVVSHAFSCHLPEIFFFFFNHQKSRCPVSSLDRHGSSGPESLQNSPKLILVCPLARCSATNSCSYYLDFFSLELWNQVHSYVVAPQKVISNPVNNDTSLFPIWNPYSTLLYKYSLVPSLLLSITKFN